jgi:hypothetical protein
MIRTVVLFVFGILAVQAVLLNANVQAWQCSAVSCCGAPVCHAPIVHLPPCCEPSPLFPPPPPIVAPIIDAIPVQQYCMPVINVPPCIPGHPK